MATQQATDNSGEAPVEVTYLTIDPSSVSDAIDLDASTPRSIGEMDSKQRKWFWGVIGAFALVSALSVITQNGWLVFLCVLCFLFLLRMGLSMFSQSRKVGAMMIGCVVAITVITLYTQHLVKPPEPIHQEESDGGALRRSLDKQGEDSYTCPHCGGMGVRVNGVTGEMGKCASCGGDGKVTREQYDRLSK